MSKNLIVAAFILILTPTFAVAQSLRPLSEILDEPPKIARLLLSERCAALFSAITLTPTKDFPRIYNHYAKRFKDQALEEVVARRDVSDGDVEQDILTLVHAYTGHWLNNASTLGYAYDGSTKVDLAYCTLAGREIAGE